MSGMMTDWELIKQTRNGDMSSFAELVQRYQSPVIHFCLRMVGSAQDAEEIAQDAFVRVYQHLSRLRPQAKFSTVLFGIARNLALNAIRDARRRGRGQECSLTGLAECGDHRQRPDRTTQLNEIETAIHFALQQLSEEHREVLLLREMEGFDYDAIAQITGCRIGTVKSRLARAREQLRLAMGVRLEDW